MEPTTNTLNAGDSTVTVRVIKSFPFRTVKPFIARHLNLEKVTVGELKELTRKGKSFFFETGAFPNCKRTEAAMPAVFPARYLSFQFHSPNADQSVNRDRYCIRMEAISQCIPGCVSVLSGCVCSGNGLALRSTTSVADFLNFCNISPADTLKLYTVAHGHKVCRRRLLPPPFRKLIQCGEQTTNLIINLEEDENLWVTDDSRTLASYGIGKLCSFT